MSLVLVSNQNKMREISLKWITDNGLILELGCGDGNFAKLLYKMGYSNYLGVDILKKNIDKCRNNIPSFDFWTEDIFSSKVFKKIIEAKIIVSFQTLEHLGTVGGDEDIKFIYSIPSKKKFIFSVPNSKYRTEHKRWFELDGWKQRYDHLLIYKNFITIQNEKKKDKRSFLFNTEIK